MTTLSTRPCRWNQRAPEAANLQQRPTASGVNQVIPVDAASFLTAGLGAQELSGMMT